jgi:16S rRNA (uracil1498-N3)-methyltransferase
VAALRIRAGEHVEVVDSRARAGWNVRVLSATREQMTAEVVSELVFPNLPHVALVQGVAKGEKMDVIVRQAVEVGAAEIFPVLTSRTVVRLDGSKLQSRGERWRRIAKGAAEQSRRTSIAIVHDPSPFPEVLDYLRAFDAVVVLWEDPSIGAGLRSAVASLGGGFDGRLALVIGPEGGLSEDEVASLRDIGATPVTLGPGILRTETAAVVALAIAMDSLGGLGTERE